MTSVRQLTGVYDADGTLRGEVAYVVGKLLGRRHCALCDITHGATREKAAWRACRAGSPVPFAVVHRDEQEPEVATASTGHLPAVLAHTDDGIEVLLDGPALDACVGEPAALMAAIEQAVAERGWVFETAPAPPAAPTR